MLKPSLSVNIDEAPSARWAMAQFRAAESSKEPWIYVLKAVPEGHDEAVGVAIVKIYEGEGKEADGAWEDDFNELLEKEFCEAYFGKLRDGYELMMGGKRHACKYDLSRNY